MIEKLYHGTNADALSRIQTFGLQGRKYTKVKGNWEHTVPSNPKAVYLTDTYAWHFAAASGPKKNDKGLILEIDRGALFPWKLGPDEDFLEQGTRGVEATPENGLAPTGWDMKRRTRFYRRKAEHLPHLVDKSLEYMGTCAYYGVIPWSAIIRYVIIDWSKLDPPLYIQALDSMVSCLNFKILKERHWAFTKWFFGDPVTAAEVAGNRIYAAMSDADEHFKRQNAVWAEAMANREGLTVVNLKEDKLAKSA